MNTAGKTPRLFRRRALLLGAAQLTLVGVLGWRMNQLGVKKAEKFRMLAEKNRINISLQPPARGLIYDRGGNLLALNRQVYTIQMVREQTNDPEAVLNRLAKLIPLSDTKIAEVLKEMLSRRAFVPVTVATGLEWEHIAAVSANAPSLPGITPKLGLNRQYPVGPDFAHIIGYVGPVSDYDLAQVDDKDP
ncbi:MAG: penicillin-binding protein 2, partial [Amylibacter sp.]|nr:penicillin-binding protein 2 [Amylibacter sp.]